MKFSIPLVQLTKYIQQLSAVCPNEAGKSNKIVQNILLTVQPERLILRATDYALDCSCELPLGDVKAPGSTTVNAVKLVGLCNQLQSNAVIAFDHDDEHQQLTISSGTSHFKVRTLSYKDFPEFAFESTAVERNVSIRQKVLKQLIEASLFCTASEDFRDYLRGVHIEANAKQLVVYASDSHRLAVIETALSKAVNDAVSVTINPKFAHLLTKILNSSDELVELQITSNKIAVKCNSYTLISNLIVSEYPAVRSIIPKKLGPQPVIVTKTLHDIIMRVAVLSTKRMAGVTFNFEAKLLKLHYANTEHEEANDQLDIDYEGDPFSITLNAVYVTRILEAIDTPEVRFAFPADISLALLEPVYGKSAPDVKRRYIISRIII